MMSQIALYNAFLVHYASWAIVLAVISIPCSVEMIWYPGNKSMRVVFIITIALWCALMLEFWKRKQARYAMQWGTMNAYSPREQGLGLGLGNHERV